MSAVRTGCEEPALLDAALDSDCLQRDDARGLLPSGPHRGRHGRRRTEVCGGATSGLSGAAPDLHGSLGLSRRTADQLQRPASDGWGEAPDQSSRLWSEAH